MSIASTCPSDADPITQPLGDTSAPGAYLEAALAFSDTELRQVPDRSGIKYLFERREARRGLRCRIVEDIPAVIRRLLIGAHDEDSIGFDSGALDHGATYSISASIKTENSSGVL